MLNQLSFNHLQAIYSDAFTELVVKLCRLGEIKKISYQLMMNYAANEHITRPELILIRISQLIKEHKIQQAYVMIYEKRGYLINNNILRERIEYIQASEKVFLTMFKKLWGALIDFYDLWQILGSGG